MGNQQQETRKAKKIQAFCLSGKDIPTGRHMTLWFNPNGNSQAEKAIRSEMAIQKAILNNKSISKQKRKELESSIQNFQTQLANFKAKRIELRNNWIEKLGTEISFEEICILQDQNVITVVCQLEDDELYQGSSLPHVTMETFDDAPPVLSNDLILQEMHSNAFLLRNEDATFERKAFLSAMYYVKGQNGSEARYSTKPSDWRM